MTKNNCAKVVMTAEEAVKVDLLLLQKKMSSRKVVVKK
jgi:hypothetical protein